jgi:predicted HicB family RNase H-like nuclease
MKPKPPGRPRLDPSGTVPVSVRVGTRQYDAMYAKAAAARLSLADWMRRTLRQGARPAPGRTRP